MSASEKLKALGGGVTPAPWGTLGGGTYENDGQGWFIEVTEFQGESFPGGVIPFDYDCGMTPADATLLTSLRNALPQIVAVVEAAELLVTEAQEIHAPEYPSTLKSYRASHAALSALEEALGGETR